MFLNEFFNYLGQEYEKIFPIKEAVSVDGKIRFS